MVVKAAVVIVAVVVVVVVIVVVIVVVVVVVVAVVIVVVVVKVLVVNHHLLCIRLYVTLLRKIKWSSLGVHLTPVQTLFLSCNRCLSHFDTLKEKSYLIPSCSAEQGSKFCCDCSKLNCCECFLAGNYQILHVTSNECFYDYSIENSY